MRCPVCADLDDRVVDSRLSDDGRVTRRRRECLGCGHRFTTFERLDEVAALVIKRDGVVQPFDPAKAATSVRVATTGRAIDAAEIDELVQRLESRARSCAEGVPSEQLGLDVLEWLAGRDQVAYLRFASVYKGFDDPDDFQREARLLKGATTPPPQAEARR